jgi:endonuclease/exonuclease/phosphatase (EEP) superfamily protein YafD
MAAVIGSMGGMTERRGFSGSVLQGLRPPGAGVLRLLSANLWNGAADPFAFAALVEAVEPDVVAVQELTEAQAAALGAVMPHGRLEPACNFKGMGIALRRPGEVRHIELPYRNARIAEVSLQLAGGLAHAIEVINVHVQAPHLWPIPAGLFLRRGQLRGIERYLDGSPARSRIVVGDFNATPVWPMYRRFARRFSDAAVAVAERQGRVPQRTWGPWHGSPRLFRIDHAFVAGLHVEDFRVLPVTGADHSAIVIDVRAPANL